MEYYGNTYGPTLTFLNTRMKLANCPNLLHMLIIKRTKLSILMQINPYCRFTFLSQRIFTERQPLQWINTPANIVWFWLVEKQVKVIESVSIASSAQDSSKYFSFVTVCNQKLIPRARL